MRGAKSDILGDTIQRMSGNDYPINVFCNSAYNPKAGQKMLDNPAANLASQRSAQCAVVPGQISIQVSTVSGSKATATSKTAKITKANSTWYNLINGSE